MLSEFIRLIQHLPILAADLTSFDVHPAILNEQAQGFGQRLFHCFYYSFL